MNIFNTLVIKEMLDAIRDKRSVMAGLYYALGAPLMMCGLFFVMINQLTSPNDLYIQISDQQRAPDLIRFLSSQGIHAKSADHPEVKAIELKISAGYAENMAKAKPAEVIIFADRANEKLRDSIRRLENELNRYSSEMAGLRLVARGIDPKVLRPLQVESQDLANAEAKGGLILGMAIFSILYAVFVSGMNLSIDTSAGERERDSLALLLSHPINTLQLVLGKVASVSAFAMVGLVLTVVVSKLAYAQVPWHELGFSVVISTKFMLLTLLLSIPLAVMAAALQLFVSFKAKSFKEAQSYLTFTLIVPMGLAMMSGYNIAPETLEWLPVSGQHQVLLSVIKGQDIAMQPLLMSTVVTVAIAVGLILAMQKSLKSEKVVFGL